MAHPYCCVYQYLFFYIDCTNILSLFIDFPIYEFLGCFQCLAVMNKLLWTFILFVCGHMFSFLLTKFTGLQLLNHKI